MARATGFDPALGVVPINEKAVKQGGTFRRSYPDTTRQQDPDISIYGSDHEWINDRLFYANGWTMELVPDMLESFELIDPKGLELLLRLRPGIKTHNTPPVNGRIFTAEDVAHSINRKAGKLDAEAAKKYARAGQFVGLNRAEVVDDVTVRLVMDSPNGSLLAAFADPRAQMIPVEQDEIGYTDPMKFVGTGPWIQTEFIEGTRQVFKANPEYYRTWDEGGRPGLDTAEKLIIADRASTLSAFITGEIGTLPGIQTHEEPQVRSSVPDAQWFGQPNFGWYHFAVNMKLPFFADGRVRRALQLSINYNELGDSSGPGWLYSGPLHVMFPEALTSEEVSKLPGYNPATREQDVAEAKKLIAAAGYPDGDGIQFKNQPTAASGLTFDMAVRQKERWAGIFPKMVMDITPVTDYASYTNLLNSREFESRTYHHTMVPDAAIDARTYYHSKGGRNYQSFEQPWADEALDKMLAAQSLEERKEAIRSFQLRYIEEGPPLLQLFVSRDSVAFHPNFGGMDLVTGTWAYGLQTYGVGVRWIWETA
ncbi:MAG: ABC transporter substrate-binding protein [Dehalococcoidia bacterium]